MSSIEIAAAGHAVFEDLRQCGAGFHGAGDEFGILGVDRPQFVFDLSLNSALGASNRARTPAVECSPIRIRQAPTSSRFD